MIGFYYYYVPRAFDDKPRLTLFGLVLIALLILFVQQGRKTAKDMAAVHGDEQAPPPLWLVS